MKKYLLIIVYLLSGCLSAQTKFESINKEIFAGNFTNATKMIDSVIANTASLNSLEKYDLEFEKDKMNRVRLDFNKTKDDVIPYIKKYYPEVNETMLEKWEKDKSLECKIIDGQKKYFARAASNLFLINKEAKLQKEKVNGKTVDKLDEFLLKHIPEIIDQSTKLNKQIVVPIKMRIKYSLTVLPNTVPDGEIIRCWLPFPREGSKRQTEIKLISINEDNYIVADNKNLQRTVYLEKKVEKDQPTTFLMELEYTCSSEWLNIDPLKLKSYDINSELYNNFTEERPPHIVFTDEIKNLSKKIVGDESNPFLKARKIFEWINDTKPWASAREYSTIENISDYCLANCHGDCGIKTLLFMTLARYNGIPTHWQSGWMMHPPEVNLHDWCEAYFEGYGWIPVDQSFGLQNSDDPKVKYFYLGGMDSYRLIVNDEYSQPLFPAKIYPRSETVDFQRGEVEWRGGNLYFDKWDYHMEVEYLENL
ncbi:MAG: transglutaminase domain-containing protein [Ignavibacteriales bacterium]|nr:transglutaminase domain-containing protein [Ignavibacteriales bacterium]